VARDFLPVAVCAGWDTRAAPWSGDQGKDCPSDQVKTSPVLFATLIPFIEELGWRGYALDRLQENKNALASSLILNVVWSLWHLPLFFVPDSYQAGLGVGTLEFWLFLLGVVPLGFAFAWIYNNTRRSTLAVILFHAMVNFTGELIAISKRADTYATLLWFVAAIGITVIWGAATFSRQPEQGIQA
jgi:membrane protease YdiL (CAAX protease family)